MLTPSQGFDPILINMAPYNEFTIMERETGHCIEVQFHNNYVCVLYVHTCMENIMGILTYHNVMHNHGYATVNLHYNTYVKICIILFCITLCILIQHGT